MNDNSINRFKTVTGYDLFSYFSLFIEFVNNYYPKIISYYSGKSIDTNAFQFFDIVKKEFDKIEPLIDLYSTSAITYEDWELVDKLSDIQNTIFKIENLSRWLRSSRTDRFSYNMKKETIQKQNQTLESVSRAFGFERQDDWVDLAIQNNVTEESYTNTGGKFLQASFPQGENFELENIVDTLSQDNIFGKDFQKYLEIKDGDLVVLEGKEALEQTFDTIMSTMAGSIPEYPDMGIPNHIFGTNENVIQYPIIFRSLLSMIQSDKRFSSFEILNIKKESNAIFIETQTGTIMGESLKKNINI